MAPQPKNKTDSVDSVWDLTVQFLFVETHRGDVDIPSLEEKKSQRDANVLGHDMYEMHD